MLLNCHISACAWCLAGKVCGLVRSTWGTSLGGDKLGARVGYLIQRWRAGHAPGKHSPQGLQSSGCLWGTTAVRQGRTHGNNYDCCGKPPKQTAVGVFGVPPRGWRSSDLSHLPRWCVAFKWIANRQQKRGPLRDTLRYASRSRLSTSRPLPAHRCHWPLKRSTLGGRCPSKRRVESSGWR